MSDRLNPGQSLTPGGSITSLDGRFTLIMQGDGNLVLYRSGSSARWATGTDGQAVGQAIMQGDGNFVLYGPGGQYIWDSATHGNPGAWLIVQDDGNVVIATPSGHPLWATGTNVVSRIVSGFLPSTSGLHFSNSFPSVPLVNIDVLGQQIAIGNAANGLCGGMAFTVRDYFDAGIPVPPDTTTPSSGPLFDYLVKRLVDSFNLVLPPPPPPITPFPPFGPGPATYMWLMNPNLPDHETMASNAGFAPRGRAWIMIEAEWPKIQADIDNGQLSPIGLVKVKSNDPMSLGGNHQVLAYGYELSGTDLAIRLYDSNWPNNDQVTMSLSIANPQHTTSVTYSQGGTIWCFFRPVYTFSSPPHAKGKESKEKESKESKEKEAKESKEKEVKDTKETKEKRETKEAAALKEFTTDHTGHAHPGTPLWVSGPQAYGLLSKDISGDESGLATGRAFIRSNERPSVGDRLISEPVDKSSRTRHKSLPFIPPIGPEMGPGGPGVVQ